jgi:hypothetical protein
MLVTAKHGNPIRVFRSSILPNDYHAQRIEGKKSANYRYDGLYKIIKVKRDNEPLYVPSKGTWPEPRAGSLYEFHLQRIGIGAKPNTRVNYCSLESLVEQCLKSNATNTRHTGRWRAKVCAGPQVKRADGNDVPRMSQLPVVLQIAFGIGKKRSSSKITAKSGGAEKKRLHVIGEIASTNEQSSNRVRRRPEKFSEQNSVFAQLCYERHQCSVLQLWKMMIDPYDCFIRDLLQEEEVGVTD